MISEGQCSLKVLHRLLSLVQELLENSSLQCKDTNKEEEFEAKIW